ncbi:hypothetical protein [Mesorhizobium sp.]|uniref:hypothetical protein n=1 Tax=Mesorhizobium sp. TaxID=1871066 RepID=UPI001202E57C|nr:hypothetical protein [Mesorhizobium sp.]TIO31177.1 MAG: hypothetical protein E5X89_24350 [Mesorhizobium sp.]TIP10500.1 MAG: hypothetical protein E5X73_22715 [Mesorhizobium sp.]
MSKARPFTVAGLLLASLLGTGTTNADEMLGSYVARISHRDHFASDGYALGNAAQMVRQDRANWHKFRRRDSDDENDVWFRTNGQRTELQRMLERSGAMNGSTRRAIVNGEPLIQVDVYTNRVRVSILED